MKPADDGPVDQGVGPDSEARWYCLSREGMATLCADEEDAKEVAAESFVLYPHNGPYRVAQMVDVAAVAEAVAADRRRLLADLSIAMQHSAWDGVLQLDDAMRNIGDALVQGPNAGSNRKTTA